MVFRDIAFPLIARGLPVIRLRPRQKAPLDNDWPSLATTDSAVIERWSVQTPDANCGVVAKAVPGGICIFEVDDPNIPGQIGLNIYKTYCVRSSVGKGHCYYAHTAASIALGNASQDDEKGRELWSFRANNAFVVSENSIHPKTGELYTSITTREIVPIPDALVAWMAEHKNEKKKTAAVIEEGAPVALGGRNNFLASVAGRWRAAGLDPEALRVGLLKMNEERCVPPLSDSEVETIAGSISRYPQGNPAPVYSSAVPAPQEQAVVEIVEEFEPIDVKVIPYPKFPHWIFNGCSIYEGFVKPICDQNSRYPEFMFVPAMALLLNYIGGKVRIKDSPGIMPSIFMVAIGRKGKVIKSSSVQDAVNYFQNAGVMAHASPAMQNAEARSLVWTVGSPEGLGKEMMKLNCRNGILFYDELATLVGKAGIESSGLVNTLLTTYESGKWQNAIKNPKDSFAFDPGSYCMSLIACCTDKNFLKLWSRLSGDSSGLDERFFFLLQPEVLKDVTRMVYVETGLNAVKTRRLIDKAMAQGVYAIDDLESLQAAHRKYDNRTAIRAEKWALGFAIDLGRDEIDPDCVERGLALAEYETKTKKYLRAFEADTREGGIQMEVIHLLMKNGGRMDKRMLERTMHSLRYGTFIWGSAYKGMLTNFWIKEEGSGKKGDPVMVRLLRTFEDEED
jgi:hypothetical protein